MDGEILNSCTGITIRYAYDYYTFHRIQRILKGLGWSLENVWQGYKANRRPGYKEIYRIVDDETGEAIAERVTLDRLRETFAQAGYPLYDEKSGINAGRPKRNKGAEHFQRVVNRLKTEDNL